MKSLLIVIGNVPSNLFEAIMEAEITARKLVAAELTTFIVNTHIRRIDFYFLFFTR